METLGTSATADDEPLGPGSLSLLGMTDLASSEGI